MLSQRNRWLLVAVLIAILLIWAALQDSAPDEAGIAVAPAPLSRGLIIYLSPASGAAQFFHIDVVTDSVQRLGDAEAVSAFDLVADGNRLVYAVANAEGGSDLWQMALSTRENELLLGCGSDDCGNPG